MQRSAGGTGDTSCRFYPGETTMSMQHEEDNPSEPTGDIFTLEHEDDPHVGPFWEREPVGKPLVAFEALPVKTVASHW